MKFGICIGSNVQSIEIAKSCGFDYVESGFSLLSNEDPSEYDAFLAQLKRTGISCESVNCFLPGSLPVVGKEVNEDALYAYVKRGMENGAKMGVKTVVFGSSGARRIPDGFPYETAVRQIISFLREIAGPLAYDNGITVVIEPLRVAETNLINTAKEGAILAAAADHPAVKTLVDLFHMVQMGDADEDILSIGSFVRHAHIAEPIHRKYPSSQEEFDYKSFISALEAVGCPRCSLEAGCSDFEKEAKIAADVLRSL